VQDVWDFAQAWTLTLGARWEQWRAYRGLLANATSRVAYPDRRRSDVSPKASLDWRLEGPWRLRLSFGKAARYPTVEELFQGSLSNGAIVNNNPNLEPERDWSTDLDLIRDMPHGQWRVSLYRDRFADTLYSQTDITLPVPVTSVQNIDAVRMRGIEFALQRKDVLPNVDIEASVAWNDATTLRDAQYPLADGKRFPRIPRLRAALFADWRFAPGWDASLGVRRSGRQYSTLDNSDFVNTYGAVSAFTVADAKLRWRFAPQWTASLGVDNLTNERYWVYHPYAGRTWFGEVSWNIGGSKS
jgi:iron complex outermembrane receptor protein